MAYDLEEQEQLAALKSWWGTYGTLVVVVVTVCALTVAGIQGWRYYTRAQNTAAATLYEQLNQAERASDHRKVMDIAAQITGRYGSTTYGSFAALSAARAGFESGNLEEARTRLQWVMQNGKDQEIRDIARLRLAGVLLDEKKHGEALAVLDERKPVESLTALYADLRGDILYAEGNRAAARGAWQLALDRSETDSPYRSMIQIKLDALGDAQ